MKPILKVLIIIIMPLMMLIGDIPFLIGDLVPDANALLGVRRRAVRRGVIIGSAAVVSTNEAAAAQQQTAEAQKQSATAQQPAAAAPDTPPPGTTLPLGTVVNSLPPGCTSEPVSGVEYYKCGENYYRAAFQGNNLVYVTAKPK